MKQLISDSQDAATLEKLGRASVQIVHDLKNQLNGLKLYATFLRKRMEKSERPADEQETIGKLIAGLERAAADMTTLVRYGRPVELRRQPHTSLCKIMNTVLDIEDQAETIKFESSGEPIVRDVDATALAEALQTITACALNSLRAHNRALDALSIRLEQDAFAPEAVIEWHGVQTEGDDPFQSFAGSNGLRMSLATKIIEAHGGRTEYDANAWRIRLPLALQES
jgi:signal transduction histidine kinase